MLLVATISELESEWWKEYDMLNAALRQITGFIPPLSSLPSYCKTSIEKGLDIATSHTLLAAASINLRFPVLHKDPSCFQESVVAFHKMVSVARLITDDMFQYLDPICGVSEFPLVIFGLTLMHHALSEDVLALFNEDDDPLRSRPLNRR